MSTDTEGPDLNAALRRWEAFEALGRAGSDEALFAAIEALGLDELRTMVLERAWRESQRERLNNP